MQALPGMRVIDLSLFLPGQYCSMLLNDLGADVIVVEPALEVEIGQAEKDLRESLNFFVNRNKRSLTLNLKSKEGKDIFNRLAKTSDVIIEGFRPGVAKRLEVDYEKIKCMNPRIIYCSISNYGQNGPYRDLVGHDLNLVGLCGLLDITGSKGGPPVIPGTTIGDIAGGLLANISILSALLARQKSGKGQYIDLSLFEGLIPFMIVPLALYLRKGIAGRRGETWVNGGFPGYNVYETRDNKYITIGATQKKHWVNLCRVANREDFCELQMAEGEKREEIFSFMRKLFKTKDRSEWESVLKDHEIGFGLVKSVDEVLRDDQLLARGVIKEVDQPSGRVKILKSPIGMSRTRPRIGPISTYVRGEHTFSILHALGYRKREIIELKKLGVV